MFATYITRSTQATVRLGYELAQRLQAGDRVYLYGDLGSGKTQFVKGIAEGLGITIIVKSPTYAYVNHYSCDKGVLHHYDLYRIDVGGDVDSLGYRETVHAKNTINVVEWADRLGKDMPEQFININIDVKDGYRVIEIAFIDPAVVKYGAVESYYNEWATPLHVREHCRLVTQICMQIAEAYANVGKVINFELLYSAAMLHDMARVCDFNTLDRDSFDEEISDEKWQKWETLRKDCAGRHHADVAYEQLMDRGFTKTAELIKLHKLIHIAEDPDAYDSVEKRILYYADKRVAHNKIISVKERFADWNERYDKENTEDEKALYKIIEKASLFMEKELFKDIEISPRDLF